MFFNELIITMLRNTKKELKMSDVKNLDINMIGVNIKLHLEEIT